eukprot:1259289-Pyramimonas_sp.AAC.1
MLLDGRELADLVGGKFLGPHFVAGCWAKVLALEWLCTWLWHAAHPADHQHSFDTDLQDDAVFLILLSWWLLCRALASALTSRRWSSTSTVSCGGTSSAEPPSTLDIYAEPREATEGPEDHEYTQLLSDLMLRDQTTTKEFTDWREEKEKKQVKRLTARWHE